MKSGHAILLKVCGMRERSNILEIASLQPDYMGFIFYDKSPRFVGRDFEMPTIPGPIAKVGVFVNESTETMLDIVNRYHLDLLQLHGSESAEQVAALKKDGRKIMKVFSVGDGFDFDSTRPYEDLADFFLFDTKGKYHGGNSRRFDWEILKKYNQRVPFFLSGGIGPADVPEVAALAKMNLHALDINSGVESAPALKDPSAVENVMRELKKINIDKTIAI